MLRFTIGSLIFHSAGIDAHPYGDLGLFDIKGYVLSAAIPSIQHLEGTSRLMAYFPGEIAEAEESNEGFGRGTRIRVHHGIEHAIQNDQRNKLRTATIAAAEQSIATVIPSMFTYDIPSTGRSAFVELVRRSNMCELSMDIAAISAVIDGLSKVTGQFTPASIQATTYYMRSSIRNAERSIMHDKEKWSIMMLLGVVDMIDRLGV